MLGQRKDAFYLFSGRTDTKSSGQDQSNTSSSSSSSGSSSSKGSSGSTSNSNTFGWTSPFGRRSSNSKNGGGFRVSNLGFKFDVANFDINAVSPTSW